jgi:hypothetical protein
MLILKGLKLANILPQNMHKKEARIKEDLPMQAPDFKMVAARRNGPRRIGRAVVRSSPPDTNLL